MTMKIFHTVLRQYKSVQVNVTSHYRNNIFVYSLGNECVKFY